MERREFIILLAGTPLVARAEARDAPRRVGVLIGLPVSDAEAVKRLTAFKQALAELGWTETRNVQFHQRGAADADGIRAGAAELAGLKPEVILTHATPATAAVRKAGSHIPTVFVSVSDPIGNGFVESLARPRGSITGFTNFEPSIGSKWIELIKELAPAVTRVAMLYDPDTASGGAVGGVYLRSAEAAGKALRIELKATPVSDAAELDKVFASLSGEPGGAVVVMPNVFTAVNRRPIIALAAKYRLPAIYPFGYFVHGGGLASYGVDLTDLFRRAASYIDAILKGAKPSDLPVQSPTKFELVINLRTARELGIIVPPALLALADEVIE